MNVRDNFGYEESEAGMPVFKKPTISYAMDCGSCGHKIPVGIGKIEYKFYTCPKCGAENYPGWEIEEFLEE